MQTQVSIKSNTRKFNLGYKWNPAAWEQCENVATLGLAERGLLRFLIDRSIENETMVMSFSEGYIYRKFRITFDQYENVLVKLIHAGLINYDNVNIYLLPNNYTK